MRDLLFGTPADWPLDLWLALDSVPLWVLVVAAMGPVGYAVSSLVLRRARRQARWPHGKP